MLWRAVDSGGAVCREGGGGAGGRWKRGEEKDGGKVWSPKRDALTKWLVAAPGRIENSSQ